MLQEHLIPWLDRAGLEGDGGQLLSVALGILAIAAMAGLAGLIANRLIAHVANGLLSRTRSRWENYALEHNLLGRLAHLAPALLIDRVTPLVFSASPQLVSIASKLVAIYIIVIGVLVFDALLDIANDVYSESESSKQVPIKGFIQVVKVVVACVCLVFVVALVIERSPLYLLSGLGALTAVLLIVFKDPILGFVAGFLLSVNKMVAIGDWIEMPSHGADGDVVEVALTTVKVRNFDKTITTIPPYDLISRSFKNWRGMKEAGGRRIARSIHIDVNSIRICSEAQLERFARIRLIRDYVAAKREEVAADNRRHGVDAGEPVNGRQLTNMGTFRAYVEAYLRSHPRINQEMTFLVRQLDPGEHGLPLQIYVFTDTTAWGEYEAIQSNIFDHLLSVIPEFGLRVFQLPTGSDLRTALGGR